MKFLNNIKHYHKNVNYYYYIILDKSLSWCLYVSLASTIIAIMWIVNTFNHLGLDLPI